ncbi:phosphoribosyltransferase domain-containing protein [Limnobaculum xujianqingii]|uniref:phosphoribosyltransferase domain-containing protein n=1 Tax=Limnobaculum xujianqingii TaxID=2738837 RepID=UPI0011289066|nr:phosphoribosyltransferase domain-containing protein [Limnobaculum xujianqingii]
MLTIELSTGVISVRSDQPADFNALFEMAERNNPKRSFLFVSKVLGKHIPVTPSAMKACHHALAAKIPADLPQPILFIGMAETAVGLAAGVHREYTRAGNQACLVTSTRHPVDGELFCEFKENHSHATDHLIYLPEDPQLREMFLQARSLVLVDDEATTGNTFCNLYQSLFAAGLSNLSQIVTVTLTNWSDGALAQRLDIPVNEVCLISGSWSWQPKEDAPIPVMPSVNVTARGLAPMATQQNWGRLGCIQHRLTLMRDHTRYTGKKVLVLGTGEFMWQPFLLGEQLEAAGAEVYLSSTTRSPISTGMAIKCGVAFSDNYGLGIANYMYNIVPDEYQHILLCCETPAAFVDPELLAYLSSGKAVLEVIVHD